MNSLHRVENGQNHTVCGRHFGRKTKCQHAFFQLSILRRNRAMYLSYIGTLELFNVLPTFCGKSKIYRFIAYRLKILLRRHWHDRPNASREGPALPQLTSTVFSDLMCYGIE